MKNRTDQLNTIYQAFYDSPKTMKEADVYSGIMRENICRYVSTLEKQNKIAFIRKRYCNVTNHLAGEYTTDPNRFPKRPIQKTLF